MITKKYLELYTKYLNGTLNVTNIAISGTDTFSVAGTSQFTGAMGKLRGFCEWII